MSKPKRNTTPPQAENALQYEVVSNLRKMGLQVVAIPNGGKRRPREAAGMKHRGTRKGFPDLMVLLPNARIHFLELKTSTGKLSPEQIAWKELLTVMGFPFNVIRTAEEATALFAKDR